MNFSNIKDWTIPEGTVKQVTDSLGRVIWEGVHDYSQDYFFIENRIIHNYQKAFIICEMI